jgi:molybdopterin/thiamine biosynthesis adenylyltransferase
MDRYSRQILFAGIGAEGQKRLRAARVLVVGCGALGSAQVEALARAGVGHLGIVDRDFVEESNLQRQTMFTEEDARARLPKAIAAARRIGAIN